MNKTRKFFWALMLLLLAVLIVLLLHKKLTSKNDFASVQPAGENKTDSQIVAAPAKKPSIQASVPAETNPPTQSSPSSLLNEGQLRMAALERNIPIDFFGKVTDQNGNPLGGVSIVANTRTIVVGDNDKPYTAFPKTNLVTGADGEFEILGMTGDVLTIEAMDKEGYEDEPGTLRGFSYDPSQHFTSSVDSPVVFRLWQKGLKQPLISGDKIFKFIPDGRHYSVDLMTGAITEAKALEGDLQFWLIRPAGAIRRQPYDWSFNVKPQSGNILQEFNMEFYGMTLAPANGYANFYENNHKASESGWNDGEGHDRFFVKIRGGQIYGRILINVDSFYDPNTGQGRLEIEYAINPSGSPILR